MVCTMSNFELCGVYYNLQSLKSTFWGLEERQKKKHAWEEGSVVETANIEQYFALEIIWWEIELF